jgi:DNA invertase Pin-like site-specific DNA recombinase
MESRNDRKRGIVYVRSASKCDGAKRSLVDQERRQLGVAMCFGWRRDEISVLEDAGASGVDAHRRGFTQLRDLIRQGAVGAIFVNDVTRVSRSAADWFAFLAECEANGVEIIADGVVVRRGTSTEGGTGDAR